MSNAHAMTTLAAAQIGRIQNVDQLNEMSVNSIVERKRKLVQVMESVMKDGEHYGKIPGTNKPTLLKAGAEVLATVFGLAPTFKITRTDFAGGHREYEITCTLTHIPTGATLGEGVGSCSTMESKYRWRKSFTDRACPECGNATGALMKSKQKPEWFCWAKKGGCGETFALDDKRITEQTIGEAKVENPDIADVYNTVLKMAKKRAQVDATLTAVGASDILTQDLEDLPAPLPVEKPLEPVTAPSSQPATSKTTTSKPAVDATAKSPSSSSRNNDVPNTNGPGLPDEEVKAFSEMIGKTKSVAELRKVANILNRARPQMNADQHSMLLDAYNEQEGFLADVAEQEAAHR